MPDPDRLSEFTAWSGAHITGDEMGPAQIFPERQNDWILLAAA